MRPPQQRDRKRRRPDKREPGANGAKVKNTFEAIARAISEQGKGDNNETGDYRVAQYDGTIAPLPPGSDLVTQIAPKVMLRFVHEERARRAPKAPLSK